MTIENVASWLIEYSSVWTSVASITVTAAAVIIAFFTLKFLKKSHDATASAEEKRLQLAGLAEAFRLLNDVKHREARKVLYNIDTHSHSSSSYDIIGIKQFDANDNLNESALENICKEIVKNDCNEIGVLASYGLLDENKFIEEGFWVILGVWDDLKKDIMDRRDRDSRHHMKHLENLRKKACEYAKKNDPRVYERFCLDMGPITNDSTWNLMPQNPR